MCSVNCSRPKGELIYCEINPIYIKSTFEVYTNIGKAIRTGICARCDAAIYKIDSEYYHADEKGLRKL